MSEDKAVLKRLRVALKEVWDTGVRPNKVVMCQGTKDELDTAASSISSTRRESEVSVETDNLIEIRNTPFDEVVLEVDDTVPVGEYRVTGESK